MTDQLLSLLAQETAATTDPELKLLRNDYVRFRQAHGYHGLESEVRDYILLGIERQRQRRAAEEARVKELRDSIL
jgi:hypothetical protein